MLNIKKFTQVFSTKFKNLNYLKSCWAKNIDKYRNFDFISTYHILVQKSNDNIVDDKTWDDLNFNSVFSKLDRNLTGIGQQYLYHTLRKYERNEAELKKRLELVESFKDNSELREKVQLSLFNLRDINTYFSSNILLSNELPYSNIYPIFYLFSFLTFSSIILSFFNSSFILLVILFCFINFIISHIFTDKIKKYFLGFTSLKFLLYSALCLAKIGTNKNLEGLEYLKKEKQTIKDLKNKLNYLSLQITNLNELTTIIFEYLNLFLLLDLISYYRSINVIRKNKILLLEVFNIIGKYDSSIAIASFLEENKIYTTPKFNSNNNISFNNLYHPLLNNPVSNSIDKMEKSILITGSNMSGKTTFIKTIGINYILSQTLYFALADKFEVPQSIVKSAINRNDNLEEGKSYFFVEIDNLKNFIELSDKHNYIFLIDEIFRGTNTRERLAASTAVLNHLSKNSFVFVTTHDIELKNLLKNNFAMYHFSEQIENNNYFFDYKIREGAVVSGNALRLLEIMNYPKLITEEAKEICENIL